MLTSIEIFKQNYIRIKDRGTERSYYPVLTNFIKEYASELKNKDIYAIAEEKAKVENREIGFPDITIRQNERLVGWIEVKLPEDSLDNPKYNKQFEKYKDALENILFTNFKQWQLWQWAEEGKPVKVKEIIFNIAEYSKGEEHKLADIFSQFLAGKVFEARTSKQLALALAKKTKLLSSQVEEAFHEANETSDLVRLKTTFEKTLIQNIEPHQFSNMMAETVAYSLFLASLEHIKRGKNDSLTLTTAIDYLPASIPILSDLYTLINKVSKTIPNIHHAAVALIDQLNAAEMAKIELKIREHKAGEDPVINFYEPFLNEYDPKEREARGVYYTPKPIVDYIVRCVDYIIKEKFNKKTGLADESVNLLDPALGTGTFLMSAMQQVYALVNKQNVALGQEMVNKEFNRVVVRHILKHFYGFELLVAPYAIAHLKLTLLLEDLGFSFKGIRENGENNPNRLKVYLANTLDDPNTPPQAPLFGYNSISEESEAARKVKKDTPILAIIGNPPYSNFGQMNKSEWILNLIKDYKVGLNERKINIDDDFIKFIRFAQWKLDSVGQGVFAMITNNTYIDGITHRRMRRSIMNSFDEVYIYNLHGNLRKKEVCPDGSKDENVFNIMTGVSINIFIKYPHKQADTIVKYCDLWGLRNIKFSTLLEQLFTDTRWKTLNPKEPNWFFTEKETNTDEEYHKYLKITDIFPIYNSGIQTKRDDLTIQFYDKELSKIIKDFGNLDDDMLRAKYNLPEDGRDWTIKDAKTDLKNNNPTIVEILYRPFDIRKTLFTGKTKGFIAYPRTETMKNMLLSPNIALLTSRLLPVLGYRHIFCSKNIIDIHAVSDQNYIHPLYIFEKGDGQLSIDGKNKGGKARKANISELAISEYSKKLNLSYVIEKGDLAKTFGPEDIFYYAYALLHSPTYRSRYAEQLKIDFPRVPVPNNRTFVKLVRYGNELVNLHMLGENPCDKSKTIFDESEKWAVRIGGDKPGNIEDWKVIDIHYVESDKRVYVNKGQYFEGIEKEEWQFVIGSYQVCDKWLKDRKKAEQCLSLNDLKQFMKIVVAIRETIRIMKEIDILIPKWPME